jgi:hypothetical protein
LPKVAATPKRSLHQIAQALWQLCGESAEQWPNDVIRAVRNSVKANFGPILQYHDLRTGAIAA